MTSLSLQDEFETWRRADLVAAAEANRWLTLEDVMAVTQLADKTIRNYVAQGKLRHYRVADSKLLRFRQADVDALMVLGSQGEHDD